MRRLSLIGLLGLSLLAVPAFAQKAADKADPSYKQKTVYDFDDDVVEGDLVKPDIETVGAAGKVKHSSLIKIRTDFIAEMLKSAEDI